MITGFRQKPVAYRLTKTPDRVGIPAKCPVADDFMGIGLRQIEDRQAIDGDPHRRQFPAYQTGIEESRPAGVVERRFGKRGEKALWRRMAPVRRPQPRNPAALLIDQDRRIAPLDRLTQCSDQSLQLNGIGAVPGKQDKAERICFREEGLLVPGKLGPLTAEDDRVRRRPVRDGQ